MSKSINILDKDYIQWVKELGSRYRRSRIKAAVKVNQEVHTLQHVVADSREQILQQVAAKMFIKH